MREVEIGLSIGIFNLKLLKRQFVKKISEVNDKFCKFFQNLEEKGKIIKIVRKKQKC